LETKTRILPRSAGAAANCVTPTRATSASEVADSRVLADAVALGAPPKTCAVLFRLPSVISRVGKSRSTLYEAIDKGVFPPPIKVGVRVSVWPEHEVDAINRAYIAGRTDEELRALVRRLVAERVHADDAG